MKITGIVATNALELGIETGTLEACIMCGYPGTISSTWQQAGRAGRKKYDFQRPFNSKQQPIDQYIITHPEYFFGKSPENGLINPDNLAILLSHIKCAAFELPFTDDESLELVRSNLEILSFLEDAKILRHVGNRWHWMSGSISCRRD